MTREPTGAASVLLLEDDGEHRQLFRTFLQRRGWVVREAAKAEAAREVLATEPVDVLVLELGSKNGWTLLEELGPGPHRPRLLCLTADARPATRDQALALG